MLKVLNKHRHGRGPREMAKKCVLSVLSPSRGVFGFGGLFLRQLCVFAIDGGPEESHLLPTRHRLDADAIITPLLGGGVIWLALRSFCSLAH